MEIAFEARGPLVPEAGEAILSPAGGALGGLDARPNGLRQRARPHGPDLVSDLEVLNGPRSNTGTSSIWSGFR